MAIAMSRQVIARLGEVAPLARFEHVLVSTTGDEWKGPLHEIGGKGSFVTELDQAQLAGRFDIGVHSSKDRDGLPDGLELVFLAREDARDVLISRTGAGLDGLPGDATVGTSSPRRAAQLRRGWPHLQVAAARGNADTRLAHLDSGRYDAVVLALSGMRRLGLEHRVTAILEPDVLLPAAGAGIVALSVRVGDHPAASLAAWLADTDATACVTAERAVLAGLGGSCLSAIAAHATPAPGQRLRLRAAVYAPDGSHAVDVTETGAATHPEDLGLEVAGLLREKGAAELLGPHGGHCG